jgi:hypothetical protein
VTADEEKKMQTSIARIERGLFGESDLGSPGLVKRVGTVEGKQKHYDKRLTTWGGIVIGATAAFQVFQYVAHR